MTIIRPATLADLPILAQIQHEQALLSGLQSRRAIASSGAWLQTATSTLDNGSRPFFVAQTEGQLVGYIRGEVWQQGLQQAPIGRIHELALDAHHYHSGAARQLVAYSRQWFREAGVEQFKVESVQGVTEEAFWLGLGAQRIRKAGVEWWMQV